MFLILWIDPYMRTMLVSLEKQLLAFSILSKTLVDQLQDAWKEVWKTLCKNRILRVLLSGFSSKNGRSFEMTIRSHTDAIDSTVGYFQQQISSVLHAPNEFVENIALCLRESLANAIIHGNLEITPKLRNASWKTFETTLQQRQAHPKLAKKNIVIRCEIKSTHVKLEVEDEGPGFNARKVSANLQRHVLKTDANDLDKISSGGRGLVIITTYMDHVFWNPRGNCITMIKRLSK